MTFSMIRFARHAPHVSAGLRVAVRGEGRGLADRAGRAIGIVHRSLVLLVGLSTVLALTSPAGAASLSRSSRSQERSGARAEARPETRSGARSEAANDAPGDLETDLGRNEVRVLSAPFVLVPGVTLEDAALPERLARLGYRRVHDRPEAPGEYFWGNELFWIYRRAHRVGGQRWPARLFGVTLSGPGDPESGRSDRIIGFVDATGAPLWQDGGGQPWIEPEVLAESLSADRAPRRPIALDRLPEHVWRTVLAAEDHRFFDHPGVDTLSVARALLANALAGRVTQGGSTITQQLVKQRDLSPRRTLGRKVSEAVRALALEAEYSKREILESYLNHVYFGHVGGLSIYGVGAAAEAYFSKPATKLDLGEAAVLAAVIQGPNRLSPIRHPERVAKRQRWVLSRMEALGWAEPEALARARRQGMPRLRVTEPRPPEARRFLSWVRSVAAEEAPERVERGRGMIVQTGIDPLVQGRVEEAVARGLERLRREHRGLRGRSLTAGLVVLDARTGAVIAEVGGDPRDREDLFDRARRAERQTGSALKPLVLLEAFDDCGRRAPLYPSRRVLDEPITLDLPSGPWSPENLGRRYRGEITIREALVSSINVPFVRIARWCGFDDVAATLRRAGLDVPEEPPPSFVLGSLGTSPAELAGAFTAFATQGVALRPRPVLSIFRPAGARIAAFSPGGDRVAEPAAAFMVRDLLRDVVRRGTGRAAAIDGLDAWGKTGSSSDWRDAWFAGGAGGVVAALWVGMDDGSPLGLPASRAAAPIWHDVVAAAAPGRPAPALEAPSDVEVLWVQDSTGRLLKHPREGSHSELFDRDHLPPGRKWWRPDPPLSPVR